MLVSPKLARLLRWATVLLIAHGIEEYTTGFHHANWTVLLPARYLTVEAGIFGTFQLMLWVMLVAFTAIVYRPRLWALILSAAVGIVLVTEVHHLVSAARLGGYYPGAVTATAFPVLAVSFWIELRREWRRPSTSN